MLLVFKNNNNGPLGLLCCYNAYTCLSLICNMLYALLENGDKQKRKPSSFIPRPHHFSFLPFLPRSCV